jgi:glutathione S-transferase
MVQGEHRTEDFRRLKNPLALLPVLELDDGKLLTESGAICEYLDELHPTPPLIGTDPWQRALTREADRIAELGLYRGAALAFQHTNPFFRGRWVQKEEVADFGRQMFNIFAARLDQLVADRTWLAGDLFTVADITAICAIDFGKVSGCAIDAAHEHLHAWLGRVRERPSCALKKT